MGCVLCVQCWPEAAGMFGSGSAKEDEDPGPG